MTHRPRPVGFLVSPDRNWKEIHTLLYAEDAWKTFGAVDVLRGVTFIISEGERVALVGPNGGGKSTILRMLAGDNPADEGRAGYRGGDLGFLRQEADLNDDHTLVEDLWVAFPDAHAIERELAHVADAIARSDGDLDTLIDRQAKLFDQFDQQYFIFNHIYEYLAIPDIESLIGTKGNNWHKAKTIASYVNKVGEECLDAAHLGRSDEPAVRALGQAYELYERQLQEDNALDFSFIQTTQPDIGLSQTFPVFAAVIIGGASLTGGKGTIIGTLGGALLLAELQIGLALLSPGPHVQQIFLGAVTIGAVALDLFLTRIRKSRAA